MSPADSTSDVQTFGTTQEIVNTEGRRGCLAPIVVHRGEAYSFAVLDGPVGHEPAPLAIEALVDDAWAPMQLIALDAGLSTPELQVSRWRAPQQAQAFRPASGWHSGAETPTPLPAAARALPSGDVDGFWGPAIRRGDDLACVVVSYTDELGTAALPAMPGLEGHADERWHLLPLVEGAAGRADDGVLVQFGHWHVTDDVDDLRLREAVNA